MNVQLQIIFLFENKSLNVFDPGYVQILLVNNKLPSLQIDQDVDEIKTALNDLSDKCIHYNFSSLIKHLVNCEIDSNNQTLIITYKIICDYIKGINKVGNLIQLTSLHRNSIQEYDKYINGKGMCFR
jgi:hypothetical protein